MDVNDINTSNDNQLNGQEIHSFSKTQGDTTTKVFITLEF
jgi:hypothetical protein